MCKTSGSISQKRRGLGLKIFGVLIEPTCSTQCRPSGRKWPSFDWTIVYLNSKRGVNHERASTGSLPRPVRACGSVADVRRRCLGRGLDIQTSHLSKDTGCLSRREGEEPCFASLRLSLSPGREKLSTPGAHRQQDARRDCSISPTGRHFGRRTTVPPFEWQTKEAICGRPSSLTYEVCPGRHFLLLFGGGVSCVPSYGRQYNVDIYI